eukprot:gnl/MRDRNA2_/MRDRNA2_28041_c0_seq1.p1 gnl/MRDRNA2_/MRDRNA2_28041_c0~~gnl/MRDRNA2_/MRDRNA2_28041_c0_seq1.p1  ORF type:complete len:526 (+),score=74.41 gnl/MRDRNA2_/MRDRNA2_28041_c0_seq1:35-1579(+)
MMVLRRLVHVRMWLLLKYALSVTGSGAFTYLPVPGGIVDRFVAPLSVEDFFAESYEQKWAYFPHNETTLEPHQRITLEDVTQWSMGKLRFDQSLEVLPHYKTQKRLKPKKGEGMHQVLHRAFKNGHSMVINSLQQFSDPAQRLVSALVDDLAWPIDAYMYLTPPFSFSYGLHCDVMDAWMVQLSGSKEWTVCNPRGYIHDEGFSSKLTECSNVTMQGGDILYVPFGTMHQAWTSDQLSSHLTINIERQCYTWGNILHTAAIHAMFFKGGGQEVGVGAFLGRGGYELEGETRIQQFLLRLMRKVPLLARVPLGSQPKWSLVIPKTVSHRDLPEGYLEALLQEWRLLVEQIQAVAADESWPSVEFQGQVHAMDLKAVEEVSLMWAIEAARVHSLQHLKGDVFFPVTALRSLSELRSIKMQGDSLPSESMRLVRPPRARVVMAEIGPLQLWVNTHLRGVAIEQAHADVVLYCFGQYHPKSVRGAEFSYKDIPWNGDEKQKWTFISTLIDNGALEVVS